MLFLSRIIFGTELCLYDFSNLAATIGNRRNKALIEAHSAWSGDSVCKYFSFVCRVFASGCCADCCRRFDTLHAFGFRPDRTHKNVMFGCVIYLKHQSLKYSEINNNKMEKEILVRVCSQKSMSKYFDCTEYFGDIYRSLKPLLKADRSGGFDGVSNRFKLAVPAGGQGTFSRALGPSRCHRQQLSILHHNDRTFS